MPDIKPPFPSPFGPGPFTSGTLDTRGADRALHEQLRRGEIRHTMGIGDATAGPGPGLDAINAVLNHVIDNRGKR